MDTLLRDTVTAAVNSRYPSMNLEGRRLIEQLLVRRDFEKGERILEIHIYPDAIDPLGKDIAEQTAIEVITEGYVPYPHERSVLPAEVPSRISGKRIALAGGKSRQSALGIGLGIPDQVGKLVGILRRAVWKILSSVLVRSSRWRLWRIRSRQSPQSRSWIFSAPCFWRRPSVTPRPPSPGRKS